MLPGVRGLARAGEVPCTVTVAAAGPVGTRVPRTVRINTLAEAAFYRHGDILPCVLRQLAAR